MEYFWFVVIGLIVGLLAGTLALAVLELAVSRCLPERLSATETVLPPPDHTSFSLLRAPEASVDIASLVRPCWIAPRRTRR